MAGVLPPNPNDPRVIRTRQLILDAFVRQLNIMDFNSITVGDITKAATINRTTFYAHFPDKYALFEAFLLDAFTKMVLQKIDMEAPLAEKTLQELIVALCNYHKTSQYCFKKYDSVALLLEENMKLHLEKLILQLISAAASAADSKSLATAATLLSWSLYGVTYRWNLEGRTEPPSELAERIMPLITSGFPMFNPQLSCSE
ncbi:TetR/AcrR family transcriptional regulator [Paenibacillus sp. S150]|uniref:TetR/AcrR family transcriptional regulator n=1 Tax=Paenibacillus sp. S150 TaxID=2749826 RepID=UPI001C55C817|nr:TetR/AcrR family transcriptional regulator [Paenibacillus sp. S150]MBW4083017.1 TetR/AcrR family transcriptional regulator [Paenibacillus sp. S150]